MAESLFKDESEEPSLFIEKAKLSHLFDHEYEKHEFTLFEYCILIMEILTKMLKDEMSKYDKDDEYDALMHFKPMYEERGGWEYCTKLYKKNEDRNEFVMKQISFLISQYAVTFSYRTNKNYDTDSFINNSFSNNLTNILKQNAPILHEHIISVIVNQYIGNIQWLEPAEFGRNELKRSIPSDKKYPLEFEDNYTIFRYPRETVDGIYIPSNFSINLNLESNGVYIFHVYMISKGDEIHIGFKSKREYQLE